MLLGITDYPSGSKTCIIYKKKNSKIKQRKFYHSEKPSRKWEILCIIHGDLLNQKNKLLYDQRNHKVNIIL